MSQDPSLVFRLDSHSGLAPYRQLVDQVRLAVSTGLLEEGDQLPSVREVVTQITINPNTVHRAYRELEHLGIAEGRAGLGTFIISRPPVATSLTERASLEHALVEWVIAARRMGIDDESINELVRSALRQDRNVPS